MNGLDSSLNNLLTLSPSKLKSDLLSEMLNGKNCILKIPAKYLDIKMESLAIYAINKAKLKSRGLCCVVAFRTWGFVSCFEKKLKEYAALSETNISIKKTVQGICGEKGKKLKVLILTCENLVSICNEIKILEESTFFAADFINGDNFKKCSQLFAKIEKNQKIICTDGNIDLEDKKNSSLTYLKAINDRYFFVTKNGNLTSNKLAQPNKPQLKILNPVKEKSTKSSFPEIAVFHFEQNKSLAVYTKDENPKKVPFYVSCIGRKLKPEIKLLQSIVLCNAKTIEPVSTAMKNFAQSGSVNINIASNIPKKDDHVLVSSSGRVVNLLENNTINVRNCEILVIDNSETILHHSYNNSVEKVLKKLKNLKQILLFANDKNTDVENFVKNKMQPNTVTLNFLISLESTNTIVQNDRNPIQNVKDAPKPIEKKEVEKTAHVISSNEKVLVPKTSSAITKVIPAETSHMKNLETLVSTSYGPRLLLNDEKKWLEDVPLNFDFLGVDLDSISKSFDELALKDLLHFDANIIEELNNINGIRSRSDYFQNNSKFSIEHQTSSFRENAIDCVNSSENSKESDDSDEETSEIHSNSSKQEFNSVADSNEFLDQLLRDAES